jgi:hypothetical protein
MINTLRITSVIAVILAGVFFVFPVVFGVRSNQQVNEFIASPGVRERFEQAADSKSKSTENRASPLVQQAEAFALYLNPPKSKTPTSPLGPKTGTIIRSTSGITPKFKVFATSYCQNNPELSLALIDEPGQGRHWVRQSSKVGHLLVEQVKDGLVVVKSGEETFELAIEQIPETTALKAASPVSAQVPSQSSLRSTLPASSKTSSGVARVLRPAAQPRANIENDVKLEELARKLIDVQRNSQTGKTGPALSDEEKNARTLELISQYKSARRPTRVSVKEAEELGDLGQTLEDAQAEPNLAMPATGKDEVEVNPVEPNQPVEENPASKK